MKVFFILFTLLLKICNAQNNVATTSAAFLEIGAGARSLAMGGAYVSVADDANSLYWNPAGMTNSVRPQIQTYYAPWLVETQFYYGSSVVPVGQLGKIGFSYTAVTMDEMMVRTVEDPEPDEYGQKFDAGNLALGVAYAKKLTDRFSFGFQMKFIQEKIWQMQANGTAIDIGTLFKTSNDINIGMSVSNFGGKLSMDGINTLIDHDIDETIYGNNDRIDGYLDAANWPLPLLFRFGLSKEFSLVNSAKVLVSIDAIHPNNNPEYVNVGTELNIYDLLFLRFGKSHLFYRQKYIENDSEIYINPEHGFSFGTGIKYQIPRGPKLSIDYVITDFGVFNSIYGYSINFSF